MVGDKPHFLSVFPTQRGLQEALAQASMLGSHTQMFACVDFVFVLIVHMHAAVCVLAYGSAGMSVYACAFVSVCPYYFA